MKFKRRILAQNFLRDEKLVAHIVGKASFGKNDLVIDIGAGEGVITGELAKVCKEVWAVEVDPDLAIKLKDKFANFPNVKVFNEDILRLLMPKEKFKVFANIPFYMTSDIIRKLTQQVLRPDDVFLIVQNEAAEKFAGIPKETQFSVLAKPWFNFEIVHQFQKSDFEPEPEVDSVLLKITKKTLPLVSTEQEDFYLVFIRFAFGIWKKSLRNGLKKIFTYEQWKRLSKDLGFSFKATPTQLTFPQWLAVFEFLMKHVDPVKYKHFF